MISKAAASPCVWSRKTPSASWWRGSELGYLAADPARGGSERRRAVVAQSGDPAAGALLGLQCRHARQQPHDLVQEPALLDRHGVLWGERVCVAGGPVQGAGEHRLSDVVLGIRGGRGRVGVVAGPEHWGRPGG